ncbi:hypothetical protein LJC46_00255 [Desulfovibrio sp. OttesenSCG-928-G15]|nr:hypothetical protein [Desulfovibrio sp. OttesenSCG-928-G15]
MKYIICEDFSGQPVPFLFPDKVAHVDMREQLPYARVFSAGYVVLENGEFVCHGGDVELGVSCAEGDASRIAEFFTGRPVADGEQQ